MTLTSRRNGTGRIYIRRFDHDEARVRVDAGEKIADLAREYGVTYNAVWYCVMPERKAHALEVRRRWRTVECELCGGPACRLSAGKLKHNPDGRVLCHGCRGITKRERLRFDELGRLAAVRCKSLDCANGARWQPPEYFGRGSKYKDVREGGIRGQCRACATSARRLYRQRHSVPCEDCGKPTSAANERRGDACVCFKCYHARRVAERETAA